MAIKMVGSSNFSSRAKKNYGGRGIEISRATSREEATSSGVNIQFLQNGNLRLVFPNEGTVLTVKVTNKTGRKEMNETEYAALMATQIALNEAFSERSDVDQAGYTTLQEEAVEGVPGYVSDPEGTLDWACATLQGKGWDAKKIAEYWMNENQRIKTASKTGDITPEARNVYVRKLSEKLIEHFPSNSPQTKKSKK